MLVVVEYYPAKIRLEKPVPIPDIYYRIGAEQGTFPVLQLPLSRWSALHGTGPGRPYLIQYYQTVHNKKMFGGLIARTADQNLAFSDNILEAIANINSYERYSIFEMDRTPSPSEVVEVTNLARSFRESGHSLVLTEPSMLFFIFTRPDPTH